MAPSLSLTTIRLGPLSVVPVGGRTSYSLYPPSPGLPGKSPPLFLKRLPHCLPAHEGLVPVSRCLKDSRTACSSSTGKLPGVIQGGVLRPFLPPLPFPLPPPLSGPSVGLRPFLMPPMMPAMPPPIAALIGCSAPKPTSIPRSARRRMYSSGEHTSNSFSTLSIAGPEVGRYAPSRYCERLILNQQKPSRSSPNDDRLGRYRLSCLRF